MNADELKMSISNRLGIPSKDLECPHQKSFMTPCLGRDGNLALAYANKIPICVGCETPLMILLITESKRIKKGE